jgi:uncharacterized cupredoxin-like copper-binding protein
VLALSTGHQVGLAVTAAAFIVFALASSFLVPRFRPQYPGGGLLAFIVVAFVFFFGMLTAVEVFGAEEKEGGEATVAETGGNQPTTVQRETTTAPAATTESTEEPATTSDREPTTTTEQKAETVHVDESEFNIDTKKDLKAGKITFEVENDGKLPHDFAIKGGKKTRLIQPGADTKLIVDLKPGKYHLYCSVPGHEAAGMKIDVTVS